MQARVSKAKQTRERPGEGKYPPDMRPAGFWIRWGAQFIDGVIFLVAYFSLSFVLSGSMLVTLLLAHGVIVFLYETMLTSSKKQGTLGKQALKIKVATREGERLSYGHSIGRYFAKVSLGPSQVIVYLGLAFGFDGTPVTGVLSLIFILGCILAAFMPRKQALQDLLARTYVVHGGRSGNRPARNRRGVKVKAPAKEPGLDDEEGEE